MIGIWWGEAPKRPKGWTKGNPLISVEGCVGPEDAPSCGLSRCHGSAGVRSSSTPRLVNTSRFAKTFRSYRSLAPPLAG